MVAEATKGSQERKYCREQGSAEAEIASHLRRRRCGKLSAEAVGSAETIFGRAHMSAQMWVFYRRCEGRPPVLLHKRDFGRKSDAAEAANVSQV